MKKNQISRRKILATAGTLGVLWPSVSPAKQLLNSMVQGLIKDSRSKVLGNRLTAQPARNLVQFNLYGAPSRWFFDNVLRPSDSDPFLQGAGVYNQISSINSQNPHLSQGSYADLKIRGFNMPHLWQYDVARANGGVRPMSELMSHMLMIRGCNMFFDGHPINCTRQVSPISGDVSITGLVADATNAFIPALNVGQTPASRAFKSRLNMGVVDIPSAHPDYISFILDIYSKQDVASKQSADSVDADVERALAALHSYSLTNQPGAEVLYNERKRAEKMMRAGIKNLGEVFGPLVAKYEDLFQRSMKLSAIRGVTDQVIPGLSFPCERPGDREVLAGLGSHHAESNLICSSDLRDMFAQVQSQNLAKQFALAEFALTEGLSSSILLTTPQERGHTLLNLAPVSCYTVDQIEKKFDSIKKISTYSVKAGATQVSKKIQLLHDSHATGWMTNVIGCNLFYRGFSSCLLELIDRLKAVSVGGGTLFDETVIQYATEFDRMPSDLGAGLTHNELGAVTSLFSGIIQKPTILGNIYVGRDSQNPNPLGTIGTAAPVPTLENKIIGINNISSTLSEMLRVPRIVPRAASLVEVKGAKLTPTIEHARNIEDEKV